MEMTKKTIYFLMLVIFSLATVYTGNSCAGNSSDMNVLSITTTEGKVVDLYLGSYALVIGNGNYKDGWNILPGAIRDSEKVAATLEKYGFKVILRNDLTWEKFNKELNKFSVMFGSNERNQLLIYYTGHSYTKRLSNDENMGYLVMVDTPIPEKDPIEFSNKTISMQAIITKAKEIKSHHVLFMFDSCFSGIPLNMEDNIIPKSISDSTILPVRQFIIAGRDNEQIPDYSPFKQIFIDLLDGNIREPVPDGYLTGEELGFYLSNKVPQYNPTQHPQYGKINDSKLDKGNFVFAFNAVNYWHDNKKGLETEPGQFSINAKIAEEKIKVQAGDIATEHLLEAAYEGRIVAVQILLNKGMDINTQDLNGFTPLIMATKRQHTETVKFLLFRGANVNIQDGLGNTALMEAAEKGDTYIVKLLLVHGAQVNVRNKNGNTAFLLAVRNANTDIVELLLKRGADVYAISNNGYTALNWALWKNHTKIVKLIRRYKAMQ